MQQVFDFVLWTRDWLKYHHVQDRTLKYLKTADTIFLSRLVGGETPEKGNHFVLWVFDFPQKEIRVYDSLKMHQTIRCVFSMST